MDKNELRAKIYERLEQYPQYKGYYEDDKGWKFALAVKKIQFESGDIMPGEYLLVREVEEAEFTRNERLVKLPALEIAHLVDGWMTSFGYWIPDTAVNCLIELTEGKRLIFWIEQ